MVLRRYPLTRLALFVTTLAAVGLACSATSDAPPGGSGSGTSGNTGGAGGAGGEDVLGTGGSGGKPVPQDPKTCAEAAEAKSYVGCDFWPTVVDNIVYDGFDYAVVVANAGAVDAEVDVTQNGSPLASATVPANGLATLYLPWVEALKSTDSFLACAPSSIKLSTVRAPGGAYHLTSSVPVTVYQYSAIEYAGKGGPPGKDWSFCTTGLCPSTGCFSFTNDASLLLPSTAWTHTYRLTGTPAWYDTSASFEYPPYMAITGALDGTTVTVKLSSTASLVAGGGVPGAGPGETISFPLSAGEVVQLLGGPGADLSGSLVTTSAPVQIIAGIACTNMPHDTVACDHVEESVFPAETLGKRYFVTVPTSHHGTPVGHVVRLYGNVDGTTLSYPSGSVGGPSVLAAGQVVDLGVVTKDFEVVADHELAVASFQVGADLIDPGLPTNQQKGDPAQSLMVSVEQYRTKYVFLAPSDYDVSFADVVHPEGTVLTLDGGPVTAVPSPIGSGYQLSRVLLGPGNQGAHVLLADKPVGLQVMGYGTYTSYQYPGGLNLTEIAVPPPK